VNYIDITLWGKQAESLSQYLAKGKQIAVDGKLKQERWTDRDTGNNRSKLGVVAFSIQLLGSGNHNGGESQSGYNHTSSANTDGYGGGYSRTSPTSASLRAAHAQNPPSDDGFVDDIPF
jgi:single-strand DNA-binding protein